MKKVLRWAAWALVFLTKAVCAVLSPILRAAAEALGVVIGAILREALCALKTLLRGTVEGMAKLLSRLAPWILAAAGLWWLAQHRPETFANLLAVAVLLATLYFLVRPIGRKKKS